MEQEARGLTGPARTDCQQRVTQCRADLTSLKSAVQRVVQRAERVELELGTVRSGGGGAADEAEESLQRSTSLLQDSRRLIAETEEIGDQAATDLQGQRQQLLGAHGKVRLLLPLLAPLLPPVTTSRVLEQIMETRLFTEDARRLLRNMSRRELRHKLVLVAIIVVLIISNILVIYYRFIKKNDD